jgi:hypothetical protein
LFPGHWPLLFHAVSSTFLSALFSLAGLFIIARTAFARAAALLISRRLAAAPAALSSFPSRNGTQITEKSPSIHVILDINGYFAAPGAQT